MNFPTNPTVILGGGFTGLFTALHLSHQQYSQPIILIDQKERFTFQPLLYEFFSKEMGDNQVCPRYEELLEGHDITFVQARVEGIDFQQQQVSLASGISYRYKYLVLALGSAINYFGIPGAREHSLPFRTGEDANNLTRHLRDCLQRASQANNPEERRRLLTIILMGAGPSGIELAGTLGDLLPLWYAKLGGDPQEIRIVLLEQMSEILRGDINNRVRDIARESLSQRTVPVDLRLEHTVTAVHPDRIEFKHGEEVDTIPTQTLVWTAGVTTHPLIRALSIPEDRRDRKGRVQVTPTLQLPDFPEVFAGGDCAAERENLLPPLAQVAYQQGRAIAGNLKALSEGKQPSPAEVSLHGSLLKLGLEESSAHLFDRFKVTGKPGHLIRQGTYLELLPTPVHNFKVTTEWLIEEIFQRHGSPSDLVGSTAGER
jgi:NADH dehydrogenase